MGVLEGCHKIGRTDNPARRVSQVNGAAPAEVRIVHLIEAADANWLERYLHTAFDHCRARGEWFRLSGNDLASLAQMTRVNGPSDVAAEVAHLHARNRPDERSRRTQINVILPPDLDAQLREYVERTGFAISHVVQRALRRDLAAPPVVTVPPLPDAPPEVAPGARNRPGRKKKG